MPKSYATTRNGASSLPTTYGTSVVTDGDEIDAVGARGGRRRGAHRGLVGAERTGERAGLAEVTGEATRVDAR